MKGISRHHTLDVPRSRENYALGNFMATLRITTAANKTLVQSRKSHLLSPSLLDWMPPFALQTTRISIVFLEKFIPTTSARLTAHIELGRRDSWRSVGNGEGKELSVSRAQLIGLVRPRGPRAFLAAYPASISLFATLVFFVSATAALCLGTILFPALSRKPEPSLKDTEAIVKRQNKKSSNSAIKTEETDADL